MAALAPSSAAPARGLFLVATDASGRISILAGPYDSTTEAADRARAVAEQAAGIGALASFGHVTVAEGASTSPSFFGRV